MRRFVAVLTVLALSGCAEPADQGSIEAAIPDSMAQTPPEIVSGVVAAEDGVDIAYDSRGSGEPTLLFVHCWACNRSFWDGQADVFAATHRVVRVDLPGHGASGADRETWTVGTLAADVSTVIQELALEDVILVGHSMGGPIALKAAALEPERVSGVACVDTLHNAEQAWDPAIAAQVIAMYEQGFEAANAQLVPMMFGEQGDPAIVQWVVDNANTADPGAMVALMADFPNLDLTELLSDLEVPVRCVNAAPLGEMIPETAIEANRAYADFDASTLDGVGHYLMLEKPDEFNQLLTAAIAELEGLSGD